MYIYCKKILDINIKMSSLDKLNKNELLKIVSKMRKNDLIKIIKTKIGGGDSSIIRETNSAIRRNLPIDPTKIRNSIRNNTLPDNEQYNKMYILNNNKIK